MDISQAVTESYRGFHVFQVEFNRVVKTTAASHALLQRSIHGSSYSSELLEILVRAAGEPWGALNRWLDPSSIVAESDRVISELAVARALAALEVYLDDAIAEMCSWRSFIEEPLQPLKILNDGELRIVKVCRQFGFPIEPLKDLVPLLQLFQLIRNCSVHRAGRASKALADARVSKTVADAHAGWFRKDSKKKLPELPLIIAGERIAIRPRHAILAVGCCRRGAAYVNKHLCDYLGERGITYQAAYNSLLREDPIVACVQRSPERVITTTLRQRHRVRDAKWREVTKVLQSLDVWSQCVKRYDALRRQHKL